MCELKKPYDLRMNTTSDPDPTFRASVDEYVTIWSCDGGGIGRHCDPTWMNADNCAELQEWLGRATAWMNRDKES